MFVELDGNNTDTDLAKRHDIVGTADENGVATIPTVANWSEEIEELMIPSLFLALQIHAHEQIRKKIQNKITDYSLLLTS